MVKGVAAPDTLKRRIYDGHYLYCSTMTLIAKSINIIFVIKILLIIKLDVLGIEPGTIISKL